MDRRACLPATSSEPAITWRPVNVPDLLEARIIVRDGDHGGHGGHRGHGGFYAGYVARTPGDGDDEWRGNIGVTHAPVGMGQREAMQAAVERAARAAWGARQRAVWAGKQEGDRP